MKMQLCFWLQEPLSEHYYKAFGIERLKKRGVELFFWDFTPWLAPRLWERKKNETYKIENYQLVHSWDAYVQLINMANVNWVVDFIGAREESNDINKKAREKAVRRITCWQVLGVRHIFPPTKFEIIIVSIYSDPVYSLKSAIKKVNRILLRKKIDSIEPDLYMCSGEFTERMIAVQSNAVKIWAHSWDYDMYLQERSSTEREYKEDYIVFIDSSTPFHSDFLLNGRKSGVTAERYYPSLNKFFERVEQQLQLPVVVAAHPVSIYDEIGNLYDGRKIFKGKTASLVRDANLVITQSSTSDNYAVLWRKPLLVITTDEKIKTRGRWNLHATCKAFETDYINVDQADNNIDLWELAQRPLKRYDFYRNGFIKREGTSEKNSWEILIDFLQGTQYE